MIESESVDGGSQPFTISSIYDLELKKVIWRLLMNSAEDEGILTVFPMHYSKSNRNIISLFYIYLIF